MRKFLSHHWLVLVVVLLSYAPFFHFRMIRTTGDEKVYIAQALEMAANGNWFCQVLGGQPDYYKGPLHILLTRLGLSIFGLNLWTALFMNLLLVMGGAVAVAEIVRKTFPEKKNLGFWAGTFFAFNVGIYGHVWASQMEAELAGIFAIAFYFLWRGKGPSSKSFLGDELVFWLLAGLAGWSKSPLHSVLLGLSGVLFWGLTGSLWQRMKTFRFYTTAGAGVLVCVLGFAPAFFLDRENFLNLYLMKETFKNGNGGPWWQSLVPMFGYYLIPWMTLAVFSYFQLGWGFLFHRKKTLAFLREKSRFWKLAVAGIVPTTFFFTYYPYRGENYTVPVFASVVFLITFFLQTPSGALLPRVRSWILWLTGLVILAIPAGLTYFTSKVPMPTEWWPNWVLPVIWILALGSVALKTWEHLFMKTDGTEIRTTVGNVLVLGVLSFLLMVLGEMEVVQLKNRVRNDESNGVTYRISYWNLNRFIWNEWGLMSLAIQKPVFPILSEVELLKAIQRGDLILARDTEREAEIRALAQKHFPDLQSEATDWHRWKTHAADGAGNTLVGTAFRTGDISVIFDHATMIRFTPTRQSQ